MRQSSTQASLLPAFVKESHARNEQEWLQGGKDGPTSAMKDTDTLAKIKKKRKKTYGYVNRNKTHLTKPKSDKKIHNKLNGETLCHPILETIHDKSTATIR